MSQIMHSGQWWPQERHPHAGQDQAAEVEAPEAAS